MKLPCRFFCPWCPRCSGSGVREFALKSAACAVSSVYVKFQAPEQVGWRRGLPHGHKLQCTGTGPPSVIPRFPTMDCPGASRHVVCPCASVAIEISDSGYKLLRLVLTRRLVGEHQENFKSYDIVLSSPCTGQKTRVWQMFPHNYSTSTVVLTCLCCLGCRGSCAGS